VPAKHEIRTPSATSRHAAAILPCVPLPCTPLACSIAMQDICESCLKSNDAYLNMPVRHFGSSCPSHVSHQERSASIILLVSTAFFCLAMSKHFSTVHWPLIAPTEHMDHFTSLTVSFLPDDIPYEPAWDPRDDHDSSPDDTTSPLTTRWAYAARPWFPLVPLNPSFDGPIFECLNHSMFSLRTELNSQEKHILHHNIRESWVELEKKLL